MLINDFGSATTIGEKAQKGNPYFMPREVLESAGDEYNAKPAHDLETFVKVLMYGTNRQIANGLSRVPPEQEQLAKFWNTKEGEDRNLCEQLRLARKAKYDELKVELKVVSW